VCCSNVEQQVAQCPPSHGNSRRPRPAGGRRWRQWRRLFHGRGSRDRRCQPGCVRTFRTSGSERRGSRRVATDRRRDQHAPCRTLVESRITRALTPAPTCSFAIILPDLSPSDLQPGGRSLDLTRKRSQVQTLSRPPHWAFSAERGGRRQPARHKSSRAEDASARFDAGWLLIRQESAKGRGLHWVRIRDGPRAGSGSRRCWRLRPGCSRRLAAPGPRCEQATRARVAVCACAA
jgi:hypothetical protein